MDSLHFETSNHLDYFGYFVLVFFLIIFIYLTIDYYITEKKIKKIKISEALVVAGCGAFFISLIIDLPLWFLWIKKYSYSIKRDYIEVIDGKLHSDCANYTGRLLDADGNVVDIDDKLFIDNNTDSSLIIVPYQFASKMREYDSTMVLPDTIYIKPHSGIVFDSEIDHYFENPKSHYTRKHFKDSIWVEWCLEYDKNKLHSN